MPQLCKKCNKIATEWLRERFFAMHRGKNLIMGSNYKLFLKRLSKFVEGSTGNVNTVLYIDSMIEYIKELEQTKV